LQALTVIGRYLGDSQPGTLHATLISLVRQCPEPRTTTHFLAWLETLPAAQLAEVLLDQEGLGVDWQALLVAALAELDPGAQGRGESGGSDRRGEVALGLLLARYPEDIRPTVAAVMHDLEATRRELVAALRVWEAA